MTKLAALRYRGGKSPLKQIGPWVAAQIPYDRFYIEPFAGMLGILLQREPSPVEIVNDTDGFVVDWWTTVRDNPDELEYWMKHTPVSRQLFNEFKERLPNEPNRVKRSGMFAYLLTNSILGQGGQWSYQWGKSASGVWYHLPDRIRPLAERLARVRIEHTDALEILDKTVGLKSAVIYCDPPYPGTAKPGLNKAVNSRVDHASMCDLIREQPAAIAVSGTNRSGYDLPGWRTSALRASDFIGAFNESGFKRTEMLWMNYNETDTKNSLL